MIPGSNLLNMALTVIGKQAFCLRRFAGNKTNDIGVDVPTFNSSVRLHGSVQAVPRSLFQSLGLNWKKNYIMIYSSDCISGVQRDSAGDRIYFGSKNFQALSENDWEPIDGWKGLLCVEIPND